MVFYPALSLCVCVGGSASTHRHRGRKVLTNRPDQLFLDLSARGLICCNENSYQLSRQSLTLKQISHGTGVSPHLNTGVSFLECSAVGTEPHCCHPKTAVNLRERAVNQMGRHVVLEGMLADVLMPDLMQHEGNLLLRAWVGYRLACASLGGETHSMFSVCSFGSPTNGMWQWKRSRNMKNYTNNISSLLLVQKMVYENKLFMKDNLIFKCGLGS